MSESQRWLSGHGVASPADTLEQAATWLREHHAEADVYGTGALVEDFERQIADLLGMQAARFMPSGTMAQPIALRVWCDESGCRHNAPCQTDVCDPATTCNAWRFVAQFAAAGVDVTNDRCGT